MAIGANEKAVEVVGPLGGQAAGKWFAISEHGVVGQSRFADAAGAWLAWREYSLRGGSGKGHKLASVVPVVHRKH
jgi:hypothetical protein